MTTIALYFFESCRILSVMGTSQRYEKECFNKLLNINSNYTTGIFNACPGRRVVPERLLAFWMVIADRPAYFLEME
ncbi:hypothetical protein Barb6_01427 [Bacteroidales bacterium Barb6]|nr:hypothetical protein Barb6XT_02236 [Bacteroidales bacterium Barb6XT]OAV71437.1 hypothetical protein Barb6_01427 [Bacteroidales bacterium Barb6]